MSKAKLPDPEKIRVAQEKAAKKVAEAKKKAEKKAADDAAQMSKDQTWLDDKTKDMSEDDKDELFRYASKNCAKTIKSSGKIVLACPLPKKLIYCVDADKFDCPDGTVGKGCKLSDNAAKALRTDKVCIDGAFVSKAEGGSYMSPYVPWGPMNGLEKLTTGNKSGVTIGTGVDLGAMGEADLQRLKEAGVSQATLDTMKPLLGKKKADACKALREAKKDGPIVFPQKDVELIDMDAMNKRVPALSKAIDNANASKIKNAKDAIKNEQKKAVPDLAKISKLEAESKKSTKFEDLTCSQQTILFSTYYHEGNIGSSKSKPLVDAMLSGDDAAVRAALVSKSQSAEKLIAARGKLELSFYDGVK